VTNTITCNKLCFISRQPFKYTFLTYQAHNYCAPAKIAILRKRER